VGLSIPATRADEEKIPVDKVPAPVLKAFKAKFPGAPINAAIKEEAGETVYEIESTLKGLGVDAVLKPDGEFVEIEEEIKTGDLPAAVAAAVKAKHPKAELKKAEKVLLGGENFSEVLVEEGGKTTGVAVEEDGKIRHK
jgi:predicted methyltransferase MtxX (methanogen marker protein 4)